MNRLLVLLLLAAGGCTAVVRGAPLSTSPARGEGIYLSTGGATRPYLTLGFVQVLGYGQDIAGVTQVGEAGLDSAVGALTHAALQMGGQGVIHIDFLDTNPQTPAERAESMAQTMSNLQTGEGGVQTKDRTVYVTGEVIKFLD